MKLIMDDGREITLSEEAQEMLEKEISQSKKVKNFSKEGDMEHWYINSYSEIWEGRAVVPKDINSFGAFTNEEFAEKIAFKQLMERKLLAFKEEYDNVKLDWRKADQRKWYICYHSSVENLEVIHDYRNMLQGTIHFSSYEIANRCIEMYKDDLIKYFKLGIW